MPIAAGLEDAAVYLVTEYVTAECLDALRRRRLRPTPDQVCAVLGTLADAVDYARARGVGHGALHPRDIFVGPDRACATGFGVVQAIERAGGRVPARRPYAAPERLSGAAWSTPADIYSLAVVAHEWLTGKRPGGAPGRDRAAGALDDVLARALAENPDDRYRTAKSFYAALEAALPGGRPLTSEGLGHEQQQQGQEPRREAHEEQEELQKQQGQEERAEQGPEPPGEPEFLRFEPEGLAAAPSPRDRNLDGRGPKESECADRPAGRSLFDLVDAVSDDRAAAEREEREGRGAPREPRELREPEEPRYAVLEPDELIDVRSSDGEEAADLHLADRGYWSEGPAEDTDVAPEVDLAFPEEAPASEAVESSESAESGQEISMAGRNRAAPGGVRAARSPHDTAVLDRSPVTVLPYAIVLMMGLMAGFLAGYAVGSRERASVSAETSPVTEPAVAPAERSSGRPSRASGDAPAPATAPVTESRPAAAASGRLLVRSTPAAARVRVDGVLRGTTPLAMTDVSLGTHRLEIERDGYLPVRREVTLTPRIPSRELVVPLERVPATAPAARAPVARASPAPRAASGTLVAASRPSGARVVLDGRVVGRTPLRLPGVAPGRHTVRLELDGYRLWTTEVTVAAGRETRVAGSLDRMRNR